MSEPTFDTKTANHWFAVEFNNRAWDLVEAEARSPDETQRMLHLAHAACAHWLEVGDRFNHQRAYCLLATAYLKAQLPAQAVVYAQQCLGLSEQLGPAQSPFDCATANACAAIAFKRAGLPNDKVAQAALRGANELDAEDRKVFDVLYHEVVARNA